MTVATDDLVARFATALRDKLSAAEDKYGHRDAWRRAAWEDELRQALREHIAKGDPLDVAAYCAFAWHHGWSVAPDPLPRTVTLTGDTFTREQVEALIAELGERISPHEIDKKDADATGELALAVSALWGATRAQELLDDLEEDYARHELNGDDLDRLTILRRVKSMFDGPTEG